MTKLKWQLFGLFAPMGMVIMMIVTSLADVFGSPVWLILAHVSGWYGHAFSTSKSLVIKMSYPSAASGGALALSGLYLYRQLKDCYCCGGAIGFPISLIFALLFAVVAILFFVIARNTKETETTAPKS